MSYTALIRSNDTGEIAEYRMDGCEWEDHSHFFWTEGNFGCDCNRALSFHRAKGMSEEEIDRLDDEDNPVDNPFRCGHDRFTVIEVKLNDGRVIKIDP